MTLPAFEHLRATLPTSFGVPASAAHARLSRAIRQTYGQVKRPYAVAQLPKTAALSRSAEADPDRSKCALLHRFRERKLSCARASTRWEAIPC